MNKQTRETLTDAKRALTGAIRAIDDALAEPDAECNDLQQLKTPDAIVACVKRSGRALLPKEILEQLRDSGRIVNEDAVYQACRRLSIKGVLCRRGDGTYGVWGEP